MCLRDSIYVHNIRDMRLMNSIRHIAPNDSGLCSLSLMSHLAFPISTDYGELQVYDAENMQVKIKIKAHDSPLSAFNFSPNGTLLATASEKGKRMPGECGALHACFSPLRIFFQHRHRYSSILRPKWAESARISSWRQTMRSHCIAQFQQLLELHLCQFEYGNCSHFQNRYEVGGGNGTTRMHTKRRCI